MINKSQLVASLNGITDIIIILDADYNVVYANKAYCKFFNIENTEMIIGKKCYEVSYNQHTRCDDCPTQHALESSSVVTLEKEINGEILKYWTYPVFNSENKIESIISYSQIITDQKKLEWELINSEKLKGIGQLAAGIAHEINNPLCSILVSSELIQESIATTDPLNELLSDIVESAQQTKKIISGLLEYSRMSVNYKRCYDIGDVIAKAISLTKYELKDKKISIDVKIENGLKKVKINMQRTVQVFLNIIFNGIDASPEKGNIFICSQPSGEDYISVTFRDNGCGIPQENISYIFNPFFTTKESADSVGLGLSIAHSIIEQQNGKIRVESELGKGSTFEVLFQVEA